MSSDIEFGMAFLLDLPRIVEIKLAMFDASGHATLLAPDARTVVLDDYQTLYAEGRAQHFVARVNGRVIAAVGAFVKSDLPFRYFQPPFYGFIGNIYTEPPYCSRGIATSLSREALVWLKRQGCHMVRLLASDAGRPIYEKLDFCPTDEMFLVFPTSLTAPEGALISSAALACSRP